MALTYTRLPTPVLSVLQGAGRRIAFLSGSSSETPNTNKKCALMDENGWVHVLEIRQYLLIIRSDMN